MFLSFTDPEVTDALIAEATKTSAVDTAASDVDSEWSLASAERPPSIPSVLPSEPPSDLASDLLSLADLDEASKLSCEPGDASAPDGVRAHLLQTIIASQAKQLARLRQQVEVMAALSDHPEKGKEVRRATRTIQRAARARAAARGEAATTIQRFWRGKTIRAALLAALCASRRIQAVARGHSQRAEYKDVLASCPRHLSTFGLMHAARACAEPAYLPHTRQSAPTPSPANPTSPNLPLRLMPRLLPDSPSQSCMHRFQRQAEEYRTDYEELTRQLADLAPLASAGSELLNLHLSLVRGCAPGACDLPPGLAPAPTSLRVGSDLLLQSCGGSAGTSRFVRVSHPDHVPKMQVASLSLRTDTPPLRVL